MRIVSVGLRLSVFFFLLFVLQSSSVVAQDYDQIDFSAEYSDPENALQFTFESDQYIGSANITVLRDSSSSGDQDALNFIVDFNQSTRDLYKYVSVGRLNSEGTYSAVVNKINFTEAGAELQDTFDVENTNESEDVGNSGTESTDVSDQIDRSLKQVSVSPVNGVARANISKSEKTRSIGVEIESAPWESSVRNVKIYSEASGDVSVSVSNIKKERPSQINDEASREVYGYQEINTSIEDSDIGVAKIDFSVNKSWIDEPERNKYNVVMKRFSDDGWENLTTRYINSTDDQYNFDASSEGFSYFAITLEDPQGISGSENQSISTQLVTEDSNRVVYTVAIIIMGLITLIGYWKREEIDERIDTHA